MSFREKPSDRQKLEKVSKCGTNTALLPRSVEDQFPKRDNVHTHTLRYTTNVKIKVPRSEVKFVSASLKVKSLGSKFEGLKLNWEENKTVGAGNGQIGISLCRGYSLVEKTHITHTKKI